MRRLVSLCALFALLVGAVFSTVSLSAQEVIPDISLARSNEESLVNRLPAGHYAVTITGERLTTRTLLKFIIVGPDGAPISADTPVRIALEMNEYDEEAGQELPPQSLDVAPIYVDGVWFVGPLAFENPGYLSGQIDVGALSEEASADFDVGIYPRKPTLPGWFTPLNLAIPVIALAIIVGLIVRRRLALYRAPQAVSIGA